MKRLLVSLLILAFAALPSCAEGRAEVYSATVTAMDTNCEITVYGEEHNKAADKCVSILLNMETELSVSLSGSKVYALNRDGSVDSGSYLADVAAKALELETLTDGAYNPCIYPLVKLWGFTTGEYTVPTEQEIAENVALVANSVLSVKGNTLQLTDGAVDFGGIAKGYAADVLAEELKASGVDAAIISLGGNIKTVGNKPDGEFWNIGISAPTGGGNLLGVLSVGECAVVTSGSYFRNFTENGKLYHHIIDPVTGYPADNGLVSVTVVADEAALADGLSTAFFVMGIDKAKAIAETLGVETVLVTSDKIYVSRGLKEKFTLDESIEGEYEVVYN